ncbi:MAG: anticodon-binding protein, partial [Moorea sp. SIO2B7]|nr:anticodon-binding protein [Moorena sp. SIO2B7]
VDPGWIDFQLSDRALAVWLQQLPQITPINPSFSEERSRGNLEVIFRLQYIHARCCSLLRLGNRQGLIKLQDEDLSKPFWQWVEPDPIPWLNLTSEGANFQLVQPTERYLINQLLTVVDALDCLAEANWVTIATYLSSAMVDFDRSCQIWGEVKQKTPQLAQARLGLIALTQFLLRRLLKDQLKVTAFVEL